MTLRSALLAVLALASAAITSGMAPASASDEDFLVAEINGRAIRMSDVYAQVESLPLGDQIAIRQRLDVFAESLVREEILFQSVLATDFSSEPELRARIKAEVVDHLIERYVRSKLEVSDEEVRSFYDANTSAIRGEELRASQILLADRAECDALQRSIESAEEFARLARARSLHRASAERDGDMGLFMNHDGPLGFESALFDMKPGQMAVFESEDGCHLVRVMQRTTPPLPTQDQVEERIRNLLMAQKEHRLLKALLDRAESDVTVKRGHGSP